MTKLGRNDQCPCGSGKKYKRCCLPQQEAAAAHPAVAAATARMAAQFAALQDAVDWDDDGLDEASNCVVDLVHEDKLDDAERAARSLLARFPYVHDGFERLGMVYEARGDRKQAAIFYRMALDFMREHAGNYDPEALHWMREKAESLEQDR